MENFRTFELAVSFCRLARQVQAKGFVKDQLGRASYSIALNLAEGRGKHTVKEQKRFFHIAMGSLRECQAILILEDKKDSKEWEMLDELGAHLYRLIERAS